MLTDDQIKEMRDKGFLHGKDMKCGHCDNLVEFINQAIQDGITGFGNELIAEIKRG